MHVASASNRSRIERIARSPFLGPRSPIGVNPQKGVRGRFTYVIHLVCSFRGESRGKMDAAPPGRDDRWTSSGAGWEPERRAEVLGGEEDLF